LKQRAVLIDVKRHQLPDGGNRVERVEVQPLVLEHAPPRFDQQIREADLGLRNTPTTCARSHAKMSSITFPP